MRLEICKHCELGLMGTQCVLTSDMSKLHATRFGVNLSLVPDVCNKMTCP